MLSGAVRIQKFVRSRLMKWRIKRGVLSKFKNISEFRRTHAALRLPSDIVDLIVRVSVEIPRVSPNFHKQFPIRRVETESFKKI